MTTIVTRIGKGSPLTAVEMDSNFTNMLSEFETTKDSLDTAVSTATVQANSAVSSASTATTQAIAAAASAASANTARAAAVVAQNNAVSVVTGGTASLTAGAALIPISNASSEIDSSWLNIANNNYPDIAPTLLLDFANSEVLDPRIAFTRASTATRTNKQGLIETVPAGVARFDYDPVTLACKGLLIEESRANLLTYSEQLDNAAWSKVASTVTANAATAPDGALTADKVVEDTASSAHLVRANATVTAGATSTISFYAKAAERSAIFVQFDDGTSTNQLRVSYNLQGLVASTVGYTGAGANGVATITNVGNGWCRVSLTGTPSGTATVHRFAIQPQAVYGVSSYQGDGTSGLYIWGAQLEAGVSPTSYIPTTTLAVTRAIDSALITGANFSTWYNQVEGTLVGGATVPSIQLASRNIASLGRATSTTSDIYISISRSADSWPIAGINNGTLQAQIASTILVSSMKMALGYALNNSQAGLNGVASSVDTVCTIPTDLTTLYIGNSDGLNYALNGHLQRVTYYPKRLPEATLQAMTK